LLHLGVFVHAVDLHLGIVIDIPEQTFRQHRAGFPQTYDDGDADLSHPFWLLEDWTKGGGKI